MSFSLWTLAGEVIPKTKGLAHASVCQARMHPPSKGGPVLGLRSRRAPIPRAAGTLCTHRDRLSSEKFNGDAIAGLSAFVA